MKTTISTRRANFEDCKGLGSLIEANGGNSIFRAAFGQFSFPTMIENSFLSLVVSQGSVTPNMFEENFVALMCINDSVSLTSDSDTFVKTIDVLSEFLPKIDVSFVLTYLCIF